MQYTASKHFSFMLMISIWNHEDPGCEKCVLFVCSFDEKWFLFKILSGIQNVHGVQKNSRFFWLHESAFESSWETLIKREEWRAQKNTLDCAKSACMRTTRHAYDTLKCKHRIHSRYRYMSIMYAHYYMPCIHVSRMSVSQTEEARRLVWFYIV